jgi:hypothetical protein
VGIPFRFGIAHDRTTKDNDANEEEDTRKEEEEEEEELPVVSCPCAARVLPVSFPPLPISKFGSNFLGHVTVINFFPDKLGTH